MNPKSLTTFRVCFYGKKFGTLFTISQGVPIETGSKMMGHTNIKTTRIYAKITKEKISQDMEALSHELKSFEKQMIKQIQDNVIFDVNHTTNL